MLSTELWVVIILVLLLVKHVIIVPYEDKKIYNMFARRDEAGLAVTKGFVDQDSEEFKKVIDTINACIYFYRKDFDFMACYNIIISAASNNRKLNKRIINKIKSNEYLKEPYEDCISTFDKSILIRLKLFIYFVIVPIWAFFIFFNYINEIINKIIEFIFKYNISYNQLSYKINKKCEKMFNDLKKYERIHQAW